MHWNPDPKLYPPYLRAWIGRGKGVGKDAAYRPWLEVRDVPSRGTSAKIPGILVNRTHHLLSELEATYFFLMESKDTTVDIKEGWPILDIDRTIELCAKSGVRHQYRGLYPAPFTIDFLLTELVGGQIQHRAASIKTPQDAAEDRVRRRLDIEYLWCCERNIPWTLVDTASFDKRLLSTLRFTRAWFVHRYEPNEEVESRFLQQFWRSYARNVSLGSLIERVAKAICLPDSLAQDTFRYCAWTHRIGVSLAHPLSLNLPLVLREPIFCD